MKTRRIVIRILAIIAILAIGAVMMVIGRGHTIYFDNKTIDADGTTYKAFYKVEVFVGDESVAKLSDGDRGMVVTMGQDFKMTLHITPKKDGKKVGSAVSLKVPYNMDGVILNLPALLSGAEEDVYMSEFIPVEVEEDTEDVVITDEFDMLGEE